MAGAEILVFLLVAVALLAGCATTCRTPSCSCSAGRRSTSCHGDLGPDVILFAFLPPLLYAAAFQASAYELRANALSQARSR